MTSTQFGSYCATAEYDSDVHTLSFSADYQATEKLKVNFGFVYNKAKDTWSWNFADRPSLNWNGVRLDQDGDGDADADDLAAIEATTASTAYDTEDQNNDIDTYSDLSYEQYEFTIGGIYNFTDTFYTKVSMTYDIFNSDEEYVYGDEDGTAYYGYIGVGWTF